MCVDALLGGLTGWQATPVDEQSQFPAIVNFLGNARPDGTYAKVSMQMTKTCEYLPA
jgi:hypothetical protein